MPLCVCVCITRTHGCTALMCVCVYQEDARMHYSLTTDGMPSGVSVVKTNVLEAKTLNPKTPLSRASADEVHIRPTPTTYTLHPTSYTLHPTP